MNRNKITIGLILLTSGIGYARAQDAVPAAGGNGTGAGGTMSYTVGQVVYTAHAGMNGSVSQGVQHTYDIVSGIGEEASVTLVAAYPNPVSDALTLTIEESDLTGFSYELYNSQGQMLSSNVIVANQTSLLMGEMSTSTYFLKVKKGDEHVRSFTIVKK